jgi:hypothetical protein
MTLKQKNLISQLVSELPDELKMPYGEIMDCLTDLGYLPQKQAVKDFMLSFKSGRQIIAKICARSGGEFRVKFFACENPPPKYRGALLQEINRNKNTYWGAMDPNRPAHLKNKCDGCGTACTGGQMGYYWKFEDGREEFRCGAYPILIPNITADDITEVKRLIAEQHRYFQTLNDQVNG